MTLFKKNKEDNKKESTWKKYRIAIRMETVDQGLIVVGIEGRRNVEIILDPQYFPQKQISLKRRSHLGAIMQSIRYSRMGIANYFFKINNDA